MLQKVKLLAIG